MLTKADAARRLIDSAVRFLFSEADPLAVNSVAMSAHQLVLDLGKHYGKGDGLEDWVNRVVKPEHRGIYWKIIKAPWNFSKHADKDPEGTLGEVSPELNEETLYLTIVHFKRLGHTLTRPMEVFRMWYVAKHPDQHKAAQGAGDNWVFQKFVESSTESRQQQLHLCRELLHCLEMGDQRSGGA